VAIFYANPTGSGSQSGTTPADARTLAAGVAGMASGDLLYVVSGDYMLSSHVVIPANSRLEGYNITPGDLGKQNGIDNRPVFKPTGNISMLGSFSTTVSRRKYSSIILDINGTTSNIIWASESIGVILSDCKFIGFGNSLQHFADFSCSVVRCDMGTTFAPYTGWRFVECLLTRHWFGSTGSLSRVVANTLHASIGDVFGIDGCILLGGPVNINTNAITNSIVDLSAVTSTGNTAIVKNSIVRSSMTVNSVRLINCVLVSNISSLFMNLGSYDFRLTATAKASVNYTKLQSIMIGLVDVPGIITDSLADLTSGGGLATGRLISGGV
jgi:hypothetical protein